MSYKHDDSPDPVSAPVLTVGDVEVFASCQQTREEQLRLCASHEALRAELEAVSARCAATVKDRDRWQEMYNAEARKHVTNVTGVRAERDAALRDANINQQMKWDAIRERDAALAEVARMQPVVEAAMRWGPERRNQVTPCAREDCDECVLIDAVLAYRAKAGEEPK